MIRFGLMTFPGLVNEVLMGKLGILSLMFCTIVLLSCGKKEKRISGTRSFIGKEIIFSDKNFNTVGNKAFKDQFLLISYVDSVIVHL